MKRTKTATCLALLVGLMATAAVAQEPTSQPGAPGVPSNDQRLSDLLAIIEGPNPPAVRRTVAQELLLLDWPQTVPRLQAVLAGANKPAKSAVAAALAELPQYLDPVYIDPLLAMLADSDADVQSAAAAALAGFRNSGVIPRLKSIVLDAEKPIGQRSAAIRALGLMTRREAIAALVDALRDPLPGVSRDALRALEQATAMRFNDDASAARAWWDANQQLSAEEWQERQIERLIRSNRELRRLLQGADARLVKREREFYLRSGDTERITLLQQYLADSVESIRLLGLELVQAALAEGKTLSAELRTQVRASLASNVPDVQAAAVRTVASFREPADADTFLQLLATARQREVRQALANGLGYVGSESAVAPLLAIVRNRDESCLTEAISALGRLAERTVLPESETGGVVDALAEVFADTPQSNAVRRERTLWALTMTGVPRAREILLRGLDPAESPVVRQAAAWGIATLGGPTAADALATLATDADAAVRKTALEGLARLGQSDSHLDALWARLSPSQEPDASIRDAAWRGVTHILSSRPPEVIESWLNRLTDGAPESPQRALELLLLLEGALGQGVGNAARLGAVRARIAAQYAALDQSADALRYYLRALADLTSAKPDDTPPVAIGCLRTALLSGRYDDNVATALTASGVKPDALWSAIEPEIEARLTTDGAAQALSMIQALQRRPPGVWPASIVEELAQLAERAESIGARAGGAPATQPNGTGS